MLGKSLPDLSAAYSVGFLLAAPLTPPTIDIIIIRRIYVNFYILTETVTTMKTKNDLYKLLLSTDHRAYTAY